MPNNGVVMSVAPLQLGNSRQDVPIPIPMRIGDEVFSQTSSLDELTRSETFISSRTFQGSLVIQPGGTLKQEFRVSFTGNTIAIENTPSHSWPKLSVELVRDSPSGRLRINEVFIRPSDHTAKGGLLYTRLLFLINKAGGCSIYSSDTDKLLELALPSLSVTEEIELLYSAKVYRKLKYIESFFNIRFLLPAEISGEQVNLTEMVFRGITEGEFVMRDTEVLLEKVLPSSFDLTIPPFSEPGELLLKSDDKIELFNQEMDLGSIVVNLKNAALANSRVLAKACENMDQPIDLRFILYDPRIFYRFDRFAKQSLKIRAKRLQRFKQKLAREEPQELVDLIDESLENDVSSDEASHIAMGWTLYHDLPDRYCPQEPELDAASGQWRVPIYLVYTSGEGGPVGEVIIDVKTGEIVNHTPVEELRSKGRALAEHILHA